MHPITASLRSMLRAVPVFDCALPAFDAAAASLAYRRLDAPAVNWERISDD